MSRQLPDLIDPLLCADKGREITGQVAISRMHRILDSLTNSEGCLEVVLRFGKDETGQRFLKGNIQGQLQLCCQRCMMPMAWPLDAGFSLALLRSEAQMESLADYYEPFMVPEEEKVRLLDLIEDEVILVLPQVPRHEMADCQAGKTSFEFGDSEPLPAQKPAATESTENPFKVLASLKKSNKAKDQEK